MKSTRLRAPSYDGGLLAAPPLDQAPALAEANAAGVAEWDYDFQGRPASWLREAVRRHAIEEARRYLASMGVAAPSVPGGAADLPGLIVTGHQPELFHPGVWVKNFAAAGIAAARGAVALNLVIDDDIPKSASIRVPRRRDGRLAIGRVDFDRWDGEAPYEDLFVRDEALFASFGRRAVDELGGLVADPLAESFWPLVNEYGGEGLPLGLRLAAARRRVEESWGVSNLEAPFSRLCQSEGFCWFASHLLAHLPRFQDVHNRALHEYRRLYGIRSKNHPVSDLKVEGDWREAPFWVWRASRPRRRPLMVRQDARTMSLRIADEPAPFLELPLAPDREACCAVERLMDLPATGVRLRTRALTTTMFSRFLLGDLFIHGIGGAKYDELGDVVAQRFFGAVPPAFLTLSLTSWLGLPTSAATPGDLVALDRELRSLQYNPDRHLPAAPSGEQRALLEEKRSLQAEEPSERRERKARFLRIREINEAFSPAVEGRRRELLRERAKLVVELDENRLARNREFALVLHSEGHLKSVMTRMAGRPSKEASQSLPS